MPKTRNTIIFLIILALAYIAGCVFFYEWFTDNLITLTLITIFTLYSYNKRGKKKEAEEKEQEREKEELSEIGFVKFHAKQAFRNYGEDTFAGKTAEEVEFIVAEYSDLFKLRLAEQDIKKIALEIVNELNEDSVQSPPENR